MLGKKVQKRTEDVIGKEQFRFDFKLEKNIYSYVYGRFPRGHKKLKGKNEYKNYSEWKEYVENKYNNDMCVANSNIGFYSLQDFTSLMGV